MNIKKLDARGITHIVSLVAVVVVFAVAGVAYLVASHADSTCSSTSTQTINGVTTTTNPTSCNSSSCVVNGVQQASCPIPKLPSTPKIPVPKPSPIVATKVFVGKVTQDGCVASPAPISNIGCSITVAASGNKTYVVKIVHGNTSTPVWGKLYGFTATKNITGKRVFVRAVPSKTQPVTYDLSSRLAYVTAY